jgi:hypothetical protein
MIVVICPTAQEEMCTTGSLRMAGMQAVKEFVGWAKRQRAHHFSRVMQRDGGHGALRLCPPYGFVTRYCFGWPKSSGGRSICGTSILTLSRSTFAGLSNRPVTVTGNAITRTTMIACSPIQGMAPQ